jgi:cell division septum initiation protein DivIVA
MPLSPDEIDAVRLPRATVGGYKARPTADLLNRVSWDYRQIVHQHDVVVEEAKQLRARVAELELELQEVKQAADGRRDLDELTRVVLATAQRASRELREAARQEAETTLRKARSRGVDVERQLANRRERALKEIAALEATRSYLYEEMHSALESLKSALVEQDQRPADKPESTALRGPVARLLP